MPLRLALAVLALGAALYAGTGAAQSQPSYYCDTWRAYYPGVLTCPVPWRVINPATVPAPSTTAQSVPSQPPAVAPRFPALSDGLDDFCKTVTLPRTLALCSDRELRALAVERQQAFDEARSRLSPDQQKALLADQNAWVKAYSEACGLSQDVPPSLPLAATVQNCMAQAGRARTAYLKGYDLAANSSSDRPLSQAQPRLEPPVTSSASPSQEAKPGYRANVAANDAATTSTNANPTAHSPANGRSYGTVNASADSSWIFYTVIPVALLIMMIVFRVMYVRARARRKKLVTERVLKETYETINQHMRALVRKRFQTLRHDDYGKLLYEPWYKEIAYFIETVLDPAIKQIGFEEYAFYQSTRLSLVLVIDEFVKQHVGSADTITFGPNLSPIDFENFCAEQLRSVGWSADTTKASGDQGTDIIAQKGDLRLVVQCKLYNHPVGNKAVQEVAAARTHEKADCAAVVSNARYTSSAQQLAATNGVLLLHHTDLRNIDDLLAI